MEKHTHTPLDKVDDSQGPAFSEVQLAEPPMVELIGPYLMRECGLQRGDLTFIISLAAINLFGTNALVKPSPL